MNASSQAIELTNYTTDSTSKEFYVKLQTPEGQILLASDGVKIFGGSRTYGGGYSATFFDQLTPDQEQRLISEISDNAHLVLKVIGFGLFNEKTECTENITLQSPADLQRVSVSVREYAAGGCYCRVAMKK